MLTSHILCNTISMQVTKQVTCSRESKDYNLNNSIEFKLFRRWSFVETLLQLLIIYLIIVEIKKGTSKKK